MDNPNKWLDKTRWTLLISLLLMVPLLIDERIGGLQPESKFRFLELGVLLAVALSLPSFLSRKCMLQINAVNSVIITCVGYTLIRAWFDPYYTYALDIAFQQCAWMLFILLVANSCQSPKQFQKFLWIAVPIQLVAMIYAFGQIYGIDIYTNLILGKNWRWYSPNINSDRGLIFAPLGQPNYYANYGAIVLLFLLTLLLLSRQWWKKTAIFLLIGFMFYTLMYTFTRGIWVSLFPALFFVFCLEAGTQLIQNREVRSNAFSYLKPAMAVFTLCAVLFGMYAAYEVYRGGGPLHHIGKRFYHGISFRDTSLRSRPLLWYAALHMWKDNALTGKGIGQYEPLFLDHVYRTSQEYDPNVIHDITKQMNSLRAVLTHNDYFQTLAEQGFIGFMLWIGLFVTSIASALYILWCTSLSPPDRITLLGCLTVIVQMSLQVVYDFPLRLPGSAMFFALAVAGILVYTRNVRALNFCFKMHVLLRLMFALASIPILFFSGDIVLDHLKASHLRNDGLNFIRKYDAAYYTNKAESVRNLLAAEEQLLTAHSLYPHDGQILHELGRVQYYLYDMDRMSYYPKLKQARSNFEAAQLTFNAPETFTMLCTVYIAEKRYDAARILSDKMLAIDPNREEAQYWAGVIDFFAGDYAQAVQHFQNELTSNEEHQNAMIYLANSFKQLKQYRAAADVYEQFLQNNPGYIQPRRFLADLYANELNELNKARQHYNTALKDAVELPKSQQAQEIPLLNEGLKQVEEKIDKELQIRNQ